MTGNPGNLGYGKGVSLNFQHMSLFNQINQMLFGIFVTKPVCETVINRQKGMRILPRHTWCGSYTGVFTHVFIHRHISKRETKDIVVNRPRA